MPFEEADEQTKLMNELARLGDKIRALLTTNVLLLDERYDAAKAQLDNALSCLVEAEAAVGYTPRLKD